MRWWRFAFVILIIALLQASAVMDLFSLTNLRIKPDLLLILLVYFAVYADSYDVVIISFAIGFAADISGMVLGPHLISFGIIGSAIAHIKNIILLKSTGQQAVAILVAGILIESFALGLTHLKAPELIKTGFWEISSVSLYSAILWFMIKWPVSAIGKWMGIGVHRFGVKTGQRI